MNAFVAATRPRDIVLEHGQVWSFGGRGNHRGQVTSGLVWVTRVGGVDEIYTVGDRFMVEPGVVVEALGPRATVQLPPATQH